MSKELRYGADVQKAIKAGVDAVADAVKVTLGPKGKLVLYQEPHGLPGTATNDGVTVARQIILEDQFENLAAQKTIEVALKTNEVSGDGTTTATVLAQAIVREGLKNITAGANPTELVNGIKKAVKEVVTYIKTVAKKVKTNDEIRNIATISANSSDIGQIIADAIKTVGDTGIVTIEESRTEKTELTTTEGMTFDSGYLTPYFITSPQTMKVEHEDCYIACVNTKITAIADISPLLQKILQVGKPLLIIAEQVLLEPLAVLAKNHYQRVIRVCAVNAPGFGDRRRNNLEDIAIMTGGVVISDDTDIDIKTVTLAQLGHADKVIVDRENTVIVRGSGKKKDVKERIKQLKYLVKTTTFKYDREKFEERLANMTGGIAVIAAGGVTESEVKTRKFKIEDAYNSVKAAMAEGIVPGAGATYLQCSPKDEQFTLGEQIVYIALREPALQILRNADHRSPESVLEKYDGVTGYDSKQDQYVDLVKSGIVDPAKTVRSALENAASIADLLLMTSCMIVQKKEAKDE